MTIIRISVFLGLCDCKFICHRVGGIVPIIALGKLTISMQQLENGFRMCFDQPR